MSDDNINSPEKFPDKEATALLPGPAGAVEALLSSPSTQLSETVAVICHPNPTQEGTMHNKVVTTLHKVFSLRGLRTVRFNYRGVGQSEGQFDQGVGEVDDLLAVIAWIKQISPNAPIALAGFSFGGVIALRAVAAVDPVVLVTVAPAVDRLSVEDVATIACPWVMAQGEADDVVLASSVETWLTSREESPSFLAFKETGHFFHGKLVELRKRLLEALPPL